MASPLIIQYTNLLHQYRDPNANAVKQFLKRHSQDSVFLRRAHALNKVFKLKEELVETHCKTGPVRKTVASRACRVHPHTV